MGCNCKKKVDKINEIYGDGGNDVKKRGIFSKIIGFISRIAFSILCAAIIIVMLVPMLIYIILCMMFGRSATLRLKDYSKYLNKQ